MTTLSGSAAPVVAAESSRTLAVLAEPESLDAVCRLIGLASVGAVAGGDATTCSQVVEQCRSTALDLRDQAGPAEDTVDDVAAPDGDLQELLGCPVRFSELDGCVAQILERGRDSYAADLSCETTTLPEVDAAFLLTVPACFGVVLRCPELLSLGELFEGGP